MPYAHLKFTRELPLTDRFRRRFPGIRPPENPRAHGLGLREGLEEVRGATEVTGGFDDRLLLKVQLRENVPVPELNAIRGIEIVSQEDKSVVLAFATTEGLAEFEARLASLARSGRATRQDILFSIQGFDQWRPEDRLGKALAVLGYPDKDEFLLDVELWPQERADRREEMARSFRDWLANHNVSFTDQLLQPSLVMFRVRCTRAEAERLILHHRDVRTVDLPPRIGVEMRMLVTDIEAVEAVDLPDGAPSIGVLDSGVTSGHPLLARAVGDAQGYLAPDREANDNDPWHGSFVSGLAVYGNVADSIANRRFVPQLRLFSGKVFEHDGEDQTEFVERAVDTAVREINDTYGCRIFNFSYGDLNKVYDGRHLRGLAYILDKLTRELNVLFVVPTGNLRFDDLPDDAREQYPDYLFEPDSALIDPAPSLNSITVGGLSNHTATRGAQRYPEHIEDFPLAQEGEPFPLTRTGPSINGAIKPDFVEEAGNLAEMRAGRRFRHAGLGVVSVNGGFAAGQPFSEGIGTSYAAPQLAHKLALLLRDQPEASVNMIRALGAASAAWPLPAERLLNPNQSAEGKERLLRALGYGKVDTDSLYKSVEQVVTLLADDSIENDRCHFYELPIPDEFWDGGRRVREVSVALAYSPEIRTTRIDYRMSKLWFNFVKAGSLEEVERAFRRNRVEGIPERGTNRWLATTDRNSGTLQASRWTFRQAIERGERLFVVVTRQDTSWSTVTDSPEPYSLVVKLADRENADANLYASVQTILTQRAQLRARART